MIDDLIKRLRERTDLSMIAGSIMGEAADRIEQLESDVIKIGELIDCYPSPSLEWQSTAPIPLEFRSNLHNEWFKNAIETLKGTSYPALRYSEEMEKKDD